MSSVQFHGPEAVVRAYESREVSSWSIWQGRQFMFKYEGASLTDGLAQLQTTLEALEGATNAIYTIKVYEQIEGGRITSKTADDGSFNFRLNADGQVPTVGALGAYNRGNELVSRLAAIEERLKEKEEEDDQEEGFSLGKVLSGVLQQPGAMEGIMNFVSGFLNNTMKPQTATALAGIGTVPPIKESLTVLATKVPDLPALLAKLVAFAEKSPSEFDFYMGMLMQKNL